MDGGRKTGMKEGEGVNRESEMVASGRSAKISSSRERDRNR